MTTSDTELKVNGLTLLISYFCDKICGSSDVFCQLQSFVIGFNLKRESTETAGCLRQSFHCEVRVFKIFFIFIFIHRQFHLMWIKVPVAFAKKK